MSEQQPGSPGRRYATPRASYRLQLHGGFTFDHVREQMPYFAALGISHLYFSPIFAAAPGSTHGYDVLNHNQINPELGGLPALYALGEELAARDIGLIVDMVPNHVGLATSANPWWCDVLRYGEASRYATYFDINWETQPHLPSGVLVYPILGQPFGASLEAGELRLAVEDNDLALRYYDHRLPLAPRSYAEIVGLPPLDLRAQLGDPATLTEFLDLLDGLRTTTVEEAERRLERFRRLLAAEPALVEYVQGRLDELNGRVGEPESFDRLETILARQYYRLAYWRVSGEEINYRRFFDINELAAIRVEREEVFEETHRLLLSLVEQGIVTGVRIDHVDGLYNPAGYLARLRDRLAEVGAHWTSGTIPIYVEKILEEGEPLPENWPVAGTTGYDFMAHNDGLFVDRGTVVETTRTYEHFVGAPVRFRQLRYDAKKQIARISFAGEINVLASQLHALAQRDRRRRDTTLRALRNALETVLATFPVYRTYVIGDQGGPGDRALIEEAIAEARRRDRTLTREALDFLAEVLLLEEPEGRPLDPDERERRVQFRQRFQQLSSPVMAKGFEDTTFYRYNRLLSLNEVGSDPSRFGAAPAEVHAWLAERARAWPHAMSASSTHDTKRSEDARARLHVLSAVPALWRREVAHWAEINARHRSTVYGEPVPEPNTEYLLYQALIASWPTGDEKLDDRYRERLSGYLTKAMREMKTYTSWTNTDERVEEAAQGFLTALLHPRRGRAFQRRIARFVAQLEPDATLNSLAALIIKATAPGFPDFYQGTDLWDRSLTDPDNRRPVDFAARQRLIAGLTEQPPADLAAQAMKLWLTRQLLRLRTAYPDLFAEGDYQPIEATGTYATNLFAFARHHRATTLVVAVPRLTKQIAEAEGGTPLGVAWGDTALVLPKAGGCWRDYLTGRQVDGRDDQVRCADLFAELSFAVLVGEQDGREGAS